MATNAQIRQQVTDTIVRGLVDGGIAPWRQPWINDSAAGFPCNVVSKRNYSGINPLLIELHRRAHNLTSRFYGTFQQWKKLGGVVKKRPADVPRGEWGAQVICCKPVTKKPKHDGEEPESYMLLKTYTIFSADQVEGDHLNHLRVGHATNPRSTFGIHEDADAAFSATNADIRHGGNKAYYCPTNDFIQMPHRHQFEGSTYYETLAHELCHWTGHASRLNRNGENHNYAFEELIAEIGSCYLCAELSIPVETEASVSYLDSWLDGMRSDSSFLMAATSQASKACDHILSYSRQQTDTPEPVVTEASLCPF